MQLIEWIKSLFCKRTHYKLPDVFGCSERPPQNCPTFLERDVHKSFQNAIYSHNIIIDDADANTQTGIPFNAIKNGIDSICNDLGDDLIGVGNLTQELGLLHTREENRQTKSNYIPLFYYDKANKKLLVIEPTVYVLKAYDKGLLEKILAELIKIANSPLETEQLALCDDVVSTVSYF